VKLSTDVDEGFGNRENQAKYMPDGTNDVLGALFGKLEAKGLKDGLLRVTRRDE